MSVCVCCRPARHTRSLFSITNDFLNTEVRVMLVWVVSDWVGGSPGWIQGVFLKSAHRTFNPCVIL